jgi:hypothetical protein
MDIKEMKENGTIDYYLDLKKYIEEFVNRNYPLSKEDFRSILKDVPTENVIQRQETLRILNEAMKDVLTKVADRNGKMINRANEGIYTEFSINDFKQEIFQMKQEMLEKLWEAQHKEEQAQAEQTGEQLVEKVVEQSEEIEIRADEIIEANREINQVERDFEQQQQSQQDMGMNRGE